MSKPVQILAGGAVVISQDSVLLVHRPRYDDWSFPKGKVDGTEIIPVTAVRECDEETGFRVALGPYLGIDNYDVAEGSKAVHYWSGTVREDVGFAPDEEVDEIAWVQVDQAPEKLTYEQDQIFLERALSVPVTSPLVILRHAKAMKRSDFSGDQDGLRPLSGKGRRQSKVLVDALDAFGIENLVSSPFVRCRETLHRYAKFLDTKIEVADALSEHGHEQDPDATRALITGLMHDPRPTVVCSHRPVMNTILETTLGVLGFNMSAIQEFPWANKLSPAAFFVVHRAFGPDGRVTLVNIEQHDVPGN
jgi:8-oxo-(d)GTP phosphatase